MSLEWYFTYEFTLIVLAVILALVAGLQTAVLLFLCSTIVLSFIALLFTLVDVIVPGTNLHD